MKGKFGELATWKAALVLLLVVVAGAIVLSAIKHYLVYNNIVVAPSGRSFIVPSILKPLTAAEAATTGVNYDAKANGTTPPVAGK